MAERSLQTVARLARRMPGYRWVRRRAVPRIRQSATARALAHRMFPSQSNGSGPPVDVAPGRLLAGVGVEQLPVVLVSLVGLAEDVAEIADVDRCLHRSDQPMLRQDQNRDHAELVQI